MVTGINPKRYNSMKRIGVFADFHCGHKSGLTPPDFWGGGRKIVDKMAERWSWFINSIKVHGPFDAAIHNGDLVDGPGVKSGNETIMSLNQQTDAAAEIIRTIGAEENFLLFGTPIHAITGDGYELERDVAKSVGSPIYGQIWLNVESWILDIRHHPAGNSQVYPATPLQKEWESNVRWAREGVQEEADLIMRAHVHKSFQTGKPDVWQAIAIPALQDFGGIYGRRLSNTVDFGWGTLDVMDKKKGVWPVWRTIMAPRRKGAVLQLSRQPNPA